MCHPGMFFQSVPAFTYLPPVSRDALGSLVSLFPRTVALPSMNAKSWMNRGFFFSSTPPTCDILHPIISFARVTGNTKALPHATSAAAFVSTFVVLHRTPVISVRPLPVEFPPACLSTGTPSREILLAPRRHQSGNSFQARTYPIIIHVARSVGPITSTTSDITLLLRQQKHSSPPHQLSPV